MLSNPRVQAGALTLPLIAFLGVAFIAPLGAMLWRSVHEPLVADSLPQTLALLEAWDGLAAPPEALYRTAAGEFRQLQASRALGGVATRVNRVQGGSRSIIMRTARELRGGAPASWREAMIAAHPAWGEAAIWGAIRRAGERYTIRHYLNALDLEQDIQGRIVAQPQERRIYLKLLGNTLAASAAITLICLALGYPLAYLIANAKPPWPNLLLLAVLLPFWSSLLVRSMSWIVMLQKEGVVNDLLVALGLVAEDGRLIMVYNMIGTMVTMTQLLLPFLILPLCAVMHGIPPLHLRAAASLGANPRQAFLHVYWPQTLPGVAAGSLLVFILAIGYYIAPALVGGRTGQFISNLIAYHMQYSLNWGLAAALNFVLLVCVLVILVAYNRLVGIERLRFD